MFFGGENLKLRRSPCRIFVTNASLKDEREEATWERNKDGGKEQAGGVGGLGGGGGGCGVSCETLVPNLITAIVYRRELKWICGNYSCWDCT